MKQITYTPIGKRIANIVFILCCIIQCISYKLSLSFFILTGLYILNVWGMDLYFEHNIRRRNQLLHLIKNDIHNIPTHPFR